MLSVTHDFHLVLTLFCSLNKVNTDMFRRCGVKHRMSSAYHPQTNGMWNSIITLLGAIVICGKEIFLFWLLLSLRQTGLDERTNQTLKISIGKTLDGLQERWEDQLKEIVFAHNSCVQASSRFSPFRLMYGREPRLFCEVIQFT